MFSCLAEGEGWRAPGREAERRTQNKPGHRTTPAAPGGRHEHPDTLGLTRSAGRQAGRQSGFLADARLAGLGHYFAGRGALEFAQAQSGSSPLGICPPSRRREGSGGGATRRRSSDPPTQALLARLSGCPPRRGRKERAARLRAGSLRHPPPTDDDGRRHPRRAPRALSRPASAARPPRRSRSELARSVARPPADSSPPPRGTIRSVLPWRRGGCTPETPIAAAAAAPQPGAEGEGPGGRSDRRVGGAECGMWRAGRCRRYSCLGRAAARRSNPWPALLCVSSARLRHPPAQRMPLTAQLQKASRPARNATGKGRPRLLRSKPRGVQRGLLQPQVT